VEVALDPGPFSALEGCLKTKVDMGRQQVDRKKGAKLAHGRMRNHGIRGVAIGEKEGR